MFALRDVDPEKASQREPVTRWACVHFPLYLRRGTRVAMSSVSDSHDWEARCKQLLAIRHGDELQLLDASRKGDLGLEAFTRDSHLGFQCYAPLETLSTTQRYEKQRDKLTQDLGKLRVNEAELVSLLGGIKLARYVFMVPEHDYRIVQHAASKAADLRSAELSILDPDFDIVVQTEENYPAERAQLISLAVVPLGLQIPDVDDAERLEWERANAELVDTLAAKVDLLAVSEADRAALVTELMNQYLRREHILAQLLNLSPDTNLRLQRRIRDRESLLAAERLMNPVPPQDRAAAVVTNLAVELRDEIPTLESAVAETLAYGTAADWMLRCPLVFGEGHV